MMMKIFNFLKRIVRTIDGFIDDLTTIPSEQKNDNIFIDSDSISYSCSDSSCD